MNDERHRRKLPPLPRAGWAAAFLVFIISSIMEKMLAAIPDHWGIKHEGSEAAVTLTRTSPDSLTMRANAHYFLTLFTTQPKRYRSLNSDHVLQGFSPAGSFEIFPLHSDLFSSWPTYKESLLIGLSDEKIRSLAQREHENDVFELIPPDLGLVDRQAHNLSLQIRQELQTGDIGHGECIDALLTLFGVHALRNHSTFGKKLSQVRNGGLSPGAWTRVNEYIMAHLGEKLTLQDLADVAFLSPSHFSRAFRVSVGQPPHQYIMSQRLAAARNLLSKTDTSFAEIAKLAGFASNSHMSTSIKKAWGLTPSQVRRKLRATPHAMGGPPRAA